MEQRQISYTPGMLVLYFVLAFAITWSILIPTLARVPESSQLPFIILAAFGPFFAAVITIWITRGRKAVIAWLRSIFTFRIPVKLFIAGAFLIPLLMGFLHYGVYRAFGGEGGLSGAEAWYLYLAYLIPTALLTGGNEEPGWRGFALPGLLERFHPVMAVLILGFFHSAWHLPLMNQYETSFGWYLFNLLPLTAILNWLYLQSRRSVIPVMLLHAGTNVVGRFVSTPGDLPGVLGDYMVLRGTAYWIIAIVLLVMTKGMLGYQPPSEETAAT
jgi:membrane protease YdiL (CAAX protease family)